MSDEKLTLLGHSGHKLPQSPEEAKLETFPNRTSGRNYRIHLGTPEFTSICPVTGQPDSAHIEIVYVPDKLCVETKSLKYFFASFRNFPAFNEAIVNRILDELVKACAPRQMLVRGEFGARGGIQLTCEARFPDWDAKEPVTLE